MTSQLRVVSVGDSDTRLKWALACAEGLGGDVAAQTITLHSGNVPTSRQLSEIGVDPGRYTMSSAADLFSNQEVAGADVVVACLYGRALVNVHRALTRFAAGASRRPVLVVGYPGLVYENHIEGLSYRLGTDVIAVNSRSDAELFHQVAEELDFDPESVVRVGYPQFASAPVERHSRGSQGGFRVTFAVQPDVPRLRSEREYVLRRLVAHARAFPNREVVVKLRSRPGEWTSHAELHHYERLGRRLAKRHGDLPANLRFEYGHMAAVLAGTDLLVTFSSTAALEAASIGVPFAILTDLGVRESLGTHAFVGSGCLTTFDDLDARRVPIAKRAWLEDVGVHDKGGIERLRARVAHLLERQAAEGAALPVTPMLDAVDRLAPAASSSARPSRLRSVASRLLTGPLRDLNARVQTWASR